MAENFQAGVCGPTWWNPSRGGLGLSSPCSPMLMTDHIGSFGWSTEPLLNLKAATSGNSDESGSVVSDHEFYKPPQMDSGGGSAVFMDSALQMLGIDLSSSSSTTTTTTSDWNQQSLLGSGRSESNYSSNPTILQEAEMNSGLNFRQETGMGCLTPISGNCTASFPAMSSAYPTTLLQTLLDNNQQQVPLPQQQSLFDDWSLNYSPNMNYSVNLNEFSSPSLRPSIPKQQNLCSWNNNGGSTFVPSAKAQYSASTFEEKRSCPILSSKVNNTEVAHDKPCSMAKRNSNEPGPTFKRPRIETPSPLPTFKVRKEKLGDRITALQQLVSPFGKTDTASVLQEAIEYIKFLHDQVNVLSTPYMKNGAAQYHQNSNKDSKDPEDPKQDLRSRGLCLVPISSTFPVATETPVDFWTPTFGGSYR